MKILLPVIAIMFLSGSLLAQKQKKFLIEDRDQIITTAIAELDSAMMAPEGTLFLFAAEKGIKGQYLFDITIREKGVVASVFVAHSTGENIRLQNALKDRVKEFSFNFKMPKGKTYKFQYQFTFE